MCQTKVMTDFTHLGTGTHAPIIIKQGDVTIDDSQRRPTTFSWVLVAKVIAVRRCSYLGKKEFYNDCGINTHLDL